MIYVPQGRRHDPVAQIWHHNAETGVGAGYRICPVTKSTSMTSCRATNSGVTQSFFSPAPGLIDRTVRERRVCGKDGKQRVDRGK